MKFTIPYRFVVWTDRFTDGNGGLLYVRWRWGQKWHQYTFEMYEAYKRMAADRERHRNK